MRLLNLIQAPKPGITELSVWGRCSVPSASSLPWKPWGFNWATPPPHPVLDGVVMAVALPAVVLIVVVVVLVLLLVILVVVVAVVVVVGVVVVAAVALHAPGHFCAQCLKTFAGVALRDTRRCGDGWLNMAFFKNMTSG